MANLPKARSNNIIIQEYGDELLIYDLDVNKAFLLNETSSLIWLECDGNKSLAEIESFVKSKLNTEFSKELVSIALDQLLDDNLIESAPTFTKHARKFDRREAIKRIGRASAVALPLITGLVAPPAANASSDVCLPNPCTNPPSGQCAGNVAVTYSNPGVCSPDGGSFSCAYPSISVNCTATGRICVSGVCVVP